MGELAFWDDLETFENAISSPGTDSLFDHDLFASEALSPTASSASLSAFPAPPPAPVVAVSVPQPPHPSASAPDAAQSTGSFLDDAGNCPLRKRVKVTITGAGSKRICASAFGGAGAPPPAKRARAGTLRFTGAGEGVQPRFNFDIRQKGASTVGGLIGKIGGPVKSIGVSAKVGKRRVGKDGAVVAAAVGKGGLSAAKTGAHKMMVRVPPAPRARTLTGGAVPAAVSAAAAAAATAAAAARSAKLSSMKVAAPKGRGKGTSFGKASKASKAAAGAAVSAAKSKAGSGGVVVPKGLVDGKGNNASPRMPLITDAMKERLAVLPVGGSFCATDSLPSLPLVLPALEAVNSAAASYRYAIGDEDPAPFDDGDFLSRLLA